MRAGRVNANSTMKKTMTSLGFRQFRVMKNMLSMGRAPASVAKGSERAISRLLKTRWYVLPDSALIWLYKCYEQTALCDRRACSSAREEERVRSVVERISAGEKWRFFRSVLESTSNLAAGCNAADEMWSSRT